MLTNSMLITYMRERVWNVETYNKSHGYDRSRI